MSRQAQFYIGLTIAAGAGIIGTCLALGPLEYSGAFFAYCVLAWFFSTFKVRLPGMTGTMSASFLFVLVSVAVFSLAETVFLASVASVVQCVVRSRKRPRLVQVAFNMATWAISSGASYRVAHWFAKDRDGRLVILLPVAACLFFVTNTFLISGVLSLIDHKSVFQTWQQCYLWTFPYYLAGSALGALTVETGRTQGWPMSLLILPIMYLLYLFYRACVQRITGAAPIAESS